VTLTEAEENIGALVVYACQHPGPGGEIGTITGVSASYVFVRYGDDHGAKATHPHDLTLLGAPS
jgi:hypothetical protein